MASRSKKSLNNIIYSITFFFLILVANFYFRKVFVDNLGVDILGLNTTLNNMISFINLAELGIGASITYYLYKPLRDGNDEEIVTIISILKSVYQKIGYTILIIGVFIYFALDQIFSSSAIDYWIIHSTYVVLLFSTLFSYFFNYKQIIFLADQKNYINIIIFQGSRFLKITSQIILIIYTENGLLWWIVLEAIYPFISTIILNLFFKSSYKYLYRNNEIGNKKAVNEKIYYEIYNGVKKKTSQLFFHKVAGFILIQASPLIVYAFTNLEEVAIYGNYMIILAGITSIITMLFTSILSSIGNFIVEHNNENVYKLYRQIQAIELFIVLSAAIIFYLLVNDFMLVWMGADFLFPNSTILLMSIFIFISLLRVNDNFLTAYGIFKDIYAPIIELSVNFIFSTILGYFFGVNGVLIGINLSLLVIMFVWKPIFLNKEVFKKDLKNYFIPIFLSLATIIGSFVVFNKLLYVFNLSSQLKYNLILTIILLFINFVILIGNPHFQIFLKKYILKKNEL